MTVAFRYTPPVGGRPGYESDSPQKILFAKAKGKKRKREIYWIENK